MNGRRTTTTQRGGQTVTTVRLSDEERARLCVGNAVLPTAKRYPPPPREEPDSIGIVEWLELRRPSYADDLPMQHKPAMSPGAIRAAAWCVLVTLAVVALSTLAWGCAGLHAPTGRPFTAPEARAKDAVSTAWIAAGLPGPARECVAPVTLAWAEGPTDFGMVCPDPHDAACMSGIVITLSPGRVLEDTLEPLPHELLHRLCACTGLHPDGDPQHLDARVWASAAHDAALPRGPAAAYAAEAGTVQGVARARVLAGL